MIENTRVIGSRTVLRTTSMADAPADAVPTTPTHVGAA
jgi:hypothetical protein